MYKEYKNLNLPEIDREILAFWEANDIFGKSVEQRDATNGYVFYEGPPSANGMPGIHHVMARTVKDLFCRYHTMKGQRVSRKGGWDTHGLPIELNVEKELGITKEDIGKKISVDDYNQKCRETVMRFKDRWDDITRKMGYWVDLGHPYITFENNYIESVWWLLKRLYDKTTPAGDRFLYKGFTVQPYSPAAGTGLSTHELNLPGCYKDVTDTSVTAMFKVRRDAHSEFLFEHDGEDVRILAWTTTPWTLPSNCALAIGEHIGYVKVRTFSPYTGTPVSVLLAKDRMPAYFSEKDQGLPLEGYRPGDKHLPFAVAGSYPGSALVGVRYEQLMPYVTNEELERDAFRVIAADFITTEDGTGVVHTAALFGADDFRACKAAGVPFVGVHDEKGRLLPLVDKQGRFRPEVTDFAGRYVREEFYTNEERKSPDFRPTDVLIAIKLKEDNKAFRVEKYKHNYPHCWRTDKPVLYYPLDSWFIRASAARERMAELNRAINWKPAHTGTGRFGVWLDNLQDWNLSRSRYWGIPLPVWRTEDGETEVVIDSVATLRAEIEKANRVLGRQQEVPADLHRPYIDEVVLVSDAGEPMYREADLIDVWFDSGAMPYAQWHYPFENQETFGRNFPADFIAEGVDQTRGWFYTLHAIATMCFDSVAFKNVVSNGLVLDKDGQKMSKSKGNVVDPFATIANHGADATRWYMITNAQPWDNLKFDMAGIEEVKRKFLGTLYNTYSFFALYANVDRFSHAEADVPLERRPEIDRWIISLLNTLVQEVDADMADYEPTNAMRRIDTFVDEHLSNWYVRLCRRRFWKGDYSEDKIAAYQTLYQCLATIAKLMAPLAPFFADWLYRNLNDVTKKEPHESVHLAFYPASDAGAIDKALEQRMDYAQRISSLVLSLRKKERIRVRQPLQKMLLPVLDEAFIRQVDGVKELILSEVNVKELEYVTDASGLIKKRAKANFKTLGARLGKDMKEAAAHIAEMDNAAINAMEKAGRYPIAINGTQYELLPEDFVITSEDIPGWQVANDGPLTVALDITLNERLVAEGTARELVNRIQNIRKNKDYNLTDRIKVVLEDHEVIRPAVDHFKDYICNETLAVDLVLSANVAAEKVELFDELALAIQVERN